MDCKIRKSVRMDIVKNLEKAISIAVKYHENQRDSEGMPKVLHPINVMFKMQTEEEMIVAVLHDVVEDTEYSLRNLSLDNFSNLTLFSVECITRRVGEKYSSYIQRVKTNDISIKVKLADLEDNMDLRRMDNISEDLAISFVKRYKPVWNQLWNTKNMSNNSLRKMESYTNIRKRKIDLFIIKLYKIRNKVMRMSYLEKAISLSVDKHKGQVDKGGIPYILHPLYVMTKMETETEKIAAVLHDIIEDTDVTFNDLKNIGFSDEVLSVLDCLTRRNGEDYFNYINRIKTNRIAVKVKLADLEHNMDLRRIKDLTDEDIIRSVKKYKRAWNELKEY